MAKRSIEDIDVASKRVLMRVDFNVPLENDNDRLRISDDRRIRLSLPSIRSVIDRGGRAVLMSHLGRPGGNGIEPALSLQPAAERLSELLDGKDVGFVEADCVADESLAAIDKLGDGDIQLLENLRFNPAEKSGDDAFAQKLAAHGDVYCNDAFGTAHRADASMVALPRAMQDRPRVAGLLLQKELTYLSEKIEQAAAERTGFIAVLGGAKVSDKLDAITNLLDRVETILVGGAMAYTFLMAQGKTVGNSLVENEMADEARKMLDQAGTSGKATILLPADHACGREMSSSTSVEVFQDQIPDEWMGLDIGPATYSKYATALESARTVVWNGPMGAFETPPFDVGTRKLAQAMAAATERGAVTIVGGGDTAAAVERFGMADQFSHVSTGGGASLEMLEGKPFESVDLLEDA